MNVIVVGLGRMGSGLAKKLDKQGYAVTAIDQDPEKFDALGEDYMGQKVVGVGFDRGVLAKAKVERERGHRLHDLGRGEHRHRPRRAKHLSRTSRHRAPL